MVDNGNVTGSVTTNLILLNVSLSDAANYDVVITNASGSVTSSVATLSVIISPAKATPIVVSGFIIGATLTDGGCGYNNPPVITISDASGSGAAAYAEISSGAVTNIVITSAGSGYSTNAVINITASPMISVVIPSADNLMPGQSYQLQSADGPFNWTNYGPAFAATNNPWRAADYWNVANTNLKFFRLQLSP